MLGVVCGAAGGVCFLHCAGRWEWEIYEELEIVKFIQIALSSQHYKEQF